MICECWSSHLRAVGLINELGCKVLLGAPHLRQRLVVLALARLVHVVAVLANAHQGRQTEVSDLHVDGRACAHRENVVDL